MPIYEFACTKCGQSFEELVHNSEVKVNCPKCESQQVVKQLSTFGVSMGDSSPCGSGVCDMSAGIPPCAGGHCPSS